MAGNAWVTRISGTSSTAPPQAYVTAIRGTAGVPTAYIAAIRGTTTTPSSAFIPSIRGYYDAAAGAPTASAGAALMVQPGSALRLSGSAVATLPATTASAVWRVKSKSSNGGVITFSDATALNPRIRVPLLRKSSYYVLGLTVVDSTGRSSPEATVRVDVRQAQILGATATSGWQPAGIDVLGDLGTDTPPS